MLDPSVKIYLVSLPDDTERRGKIEKSFPKYYEQFQRVDAVKGRDLSVSEFYQYVEKTYINQNRRLLSPGELGCSLSHVKLYKDFLASGASHALVLEDDVIGDDAAIESVLGLLNDLPEEALLICGGQEGLDTRKYQMGKKISQGPATLFRVAKFSQQYTFRGCCYVITRKSAQAVLDKQFQFIALADDWDWYLSGTSLDMYYTKLFEHPLDLSTSHIEKDRAVFVEKSIWKKLFSSKGPERIARKIYQNFFVLWYRLRGYQRLP